jgi:hypothetical protein
VVFHDADPASLRAAVDSLRTLRFNTGALRARAEAFSRGVFEARFRAFASRSLEDAATSGTAERFLPTW